MSPYEYQQLAGVTEKPLAFEERLQHGLLGITSEAGEIADTIKKFVIYSQPLDTDNLKEELGDILWYIALLANAADLQLEEIMEENIAKLQRRYPEKYSDADAMRRRDK